MPQYLCQLDGPDGPVDEIIIAPDAALARAQLATRGVVLLSMELLDADDPPPPVTPPPVTPPPMTPDPLADFVPVHGAAPGRFAGGMAVRLTVAGLVLGGGLVLMGLLWWGWWPGAGAAPDDAAAATVLGAASYQAIAAHPPPPPPVLLPLPPSDLDADTLRQASQDELLALYPQAQTERGRAQIISRLVLVLILDSEEGDTDPGDLNQPETARPLRDALRQIANTGDVETVLALVGALWMHAGDTYTGTPLLIELHQLAGARLQALAAADPSVPQRLHAGLLPRVRRAGVWLGPFLRAAGPALPGGTAGVWALDDIASASGSPQRALHDGGKAIARLWLARHADQPVDTAYLIASTALARHVSAAQMATLGATLLRDCPTPLLPVFPVERLRKIGAPRIRLILSEERQHAASDRARLDALLLIERRWLP